MINHSPSNFNLTLQRMKLADTTTWLMRLAQKAPCWGLYSHPDDLGELHGGGNLLVGILVKVDCIFYWSSNDIKGDSSILKVGHGVLPSVSCYDWSMGRLYICLVLKSQPTVMNAWPKFPGCSEAFKYDERTEGWTHLVGIDSHLASGRMCCWSCPRARWLTSRDSLRLLGSATAVSWPEWDLEWGLGGPSWALFCLEADMVLTE